MFINALSFLQVLILPSRRSDPAALIVNLAHLQHAVKLCRHYGKALFEVFKFLGVQDIAYNQPKSLPYPTENPWA